MSQTKFYGLVTVAYLLLALPVMWLLGAPFTEWLALVFTCLVALGIFAWRERRRNVRPAELRDLARSIQANRWLWQRLETEWVGRTVRLKEDIRNSQEPEGRQLYVRAGTVGKIVALNRDEYAPFTVLFPGFAHKVKVRLDKLDVPRDESPVGNLPDQQPAHWRIWLRGGDSLGPPARHAFDEDDIPEDAEAFVDEMEDFAARDWFLWNHGHARLAYRQPDYRN